MWMLLRNLRLFIPPKVRQLWRLSKFEIKKNVVGIVPIHAERRPQARFVSSNQKSRVVPWGEGS